jgi:CheY-like chemotaxis protein
MPLQNLLVLDHHKGFDILHNQLRGVDGLTVDGLTTDYDLVWDRLWDKSPDLILMEVQLDGADGRHLCSRLKRSNFTQAIPVILMTAVQNCSAHLAGYGADGVIYRPFAVPQLLSVMDSACRLYATLS